MATSMITSPDGTRFKINHPDDATDEQVMEYGQQQFASKSQTQQGFLDRVGDRFEERKAEIEQTESDLLTGKLDGVSGRLQGAVQVAGKGVAGLAMDVIGEGIVSTGRGISYITPDNIEQTVVEGFKDAWNWLSKTGTGEVASKAIQGGTESWQRWKNENQQAAKTVESVVNVGLLLAPVKTKANAGPTVIGKQAQKLGKVTAKQLATRKAAHAQDLVSPIKTPTVKLAETARTTEKGSGILKRSVIAPSAVEKEMAAEVSRIKGVLPTNSVQGNLNRVSQENLRLAKTLERDVAKSRVAIPLSESSTALDKTLAEILAKNPTIVGSVENTATRVVDQAKRIIDKNGPTGAGLLKSRKELDAWIRTQKGTGVFDPKVENALSIAVRETRDTMNDLLDSKITNTSVKRDLKRQRLLFGAMENISPKAAKEANTAIGRAWQNAVSVLPFKNKLIQEAALLTGIGGLGAAAAFAPLITAGLGATVTGQRVYRVVISPRSKIFAGKVLNAVDKALLSSSNPSMLKQLRADRALIVELLETAEVSAEPKEEKKQGSLQDAL